MSYLTKHLQAAFKKRYEVTVIVNINGARVTIPVEVDAISRGIASRKATQAVKENIVYTTEATKRVKK